MSFRLVVTGKNRDLPANVFAHRLLGEAPKPMRHFDEAQVVRNYLTECAILAGIGVAIITLMIVTAHL